MGVNFTKLFPFSEVTVTCLEEKAESERGSEGQTRFLPRKDGERTTQVFECAKPFLLYYDKRSGSFREVSRRTVLAFLSSLDERLLFLEGSRG